ncbi:MAG TPA: preprotein translocase subunit SecG [Sedimentisphaerales bacterium]|nr:preprotein translocase subunit SecG [Sedimentisphaerales bacterium]
MTVFPFLAAVPFLMKIVAAIWMICCVFLILVVMIQKSKGGGLSATFGGGGAGGVLGSKTGDFLTWFTIVLVGVFLVLSIVMTKYYKPTVGDFGASQAVEQTQQVPATDEQPATEQSSEQPAEQPAEPVMPEGGAETN